MEGIFLADPRAPRKKAILELYGYDVTIAMDGQEALQILMKDASEYRLIILNMQIPSFDGMRLLRFIRHESNNPGVRVMMISDIDDEDLLVMALRAGADSFISKPVSPRKLLANTDVLIRRAGEDKVPSLSRGIKSLTIRENQILQILSTGLTNQEIATDLNISLTTVKNHFAHIFQKLHVRNRTEAAALGLKMTR